MKNWTDPRYATLVEAFDKLKPVTMGNCSNCKGMGKIIMRDGKGNQWAVICQPCGGSGQK